MRILTTTILMAALAAFSFAAGTPDFSGKWKLNLDKSEFPEAAGPGPARKPTSLEREITQDASKILMKATQPGRDGAPVTREFTLMLDGSETTSTNPRGSTKTKVHFEGRKLVSESASEFKTPQGDTISVTTTDEWSLSNDGKVMTVNSKISGPFGDNEIKYVFEKVE